MNSTFKSLPRKWCSSQKT